MWPLRRHRPHLQRWTCGPSPPCMEKKRRQDAGVWVKGTGMAGAPTPKAAAFSADGLGRLPSPGSEGSVSTILKVCEHSLTPPRHPVQTPRQSRRVVEAGAHLLTPQSHHPESQLFCSLNGFALPGAPPPSSLSELKTNSKRLCYHHVAATQLLAKAGKSGLLIPRTLREGEELFREGGT